jgi:pimeloyl-ACP methyl ester carboxylesterase
VPSAATYTDRETNVGGLKLHYQEWGQADAPTILMVHGFGVSGHMFDEFAGRMADRYHLIALDQRGHGDSDWSEEGDYSRDAFVNDLEGFRAALGLERFVLIGHSMGGLNAVSYTVAHPEHVSALVLVDVGPESAKEGVDNIVRFTQGPDQLDFEEFVELAHRFNPRRSIENIRERMRHRLRPLPDGKWTWKFDSRFRDPSRPLRIGSDLTGDQIWQLYRDVRPPTLLVRGGESDVLVADVAERCVREMRRARLVTVPGAGHSVPGDAPDAFTEAVNGFIEDVGRGRFEPEISITPPPLSELMTVQDRAGGRRRPGAVTFIAVTAGAALAIVGVTLATKRARRSQPVTGAAAPAAETKPAKASRKERKGKRGGTTVATAAAPPDIAAIIDDMDAVSRRAMARAREVVATTPAIQRTKKRGLALGGGVLAWKLTTLPIRLLLPAAAPKKQKKRGLLPWRS